MFIQRQVKHIPEDETQKTESINLIKYRKRSLWEKYFSFKNE